MPGASKPVHETVTTCVISSDELQISFPNYTVTFTSPAVTAGVLAILAAVGPGAERAEVVAEAASAAQLDPAVIEYLVESLLSAKCLALGRQEVTGPLHEFHAYVSDSADDLVDRLGAARCVLLQPADDPGGLADALRGLELRVDIVEAAHGAATATILESVAEALESSTVLGCWNVPYRSPFARQVNELGLAGTLPVLFGSCEGVVGRVGPFVIPQNTACLECLNQRLLTHAGGPELRAYRQYRLHNDEVGHPPGNCGRRINPVDRPWGEALQPVQQQRIMGAGEHDRVGAPTAGRHEAGRDFLRDGVVIDCDTA